MFYKAFTVVGVVNDTTLDEGLPSILEEPRKLISVLINLDTHEGNVVEGWIGTKRVLEIYDYVLDTQEAAGGANAYMSTGKIVEIPVEMDIPPGELFKIGIRCGAAANDLFGAYKYDVAS